MSPKESKKIDLNLVISNLRMRSLSEPCLSNPICCLEPFPLVEPILEVDVQLLKNKCVGGYREGNCVLYISLVNNLGMSVLVMEEKHKS